MQQISEEFRLLWFVGLNVLLLAAAARAAVAFAGRRRSWVLLDVILLNYLVQYGLVCGLGVLGLLTPANLTWGGIFAAAALVIVSRLGTTGSKTEPADPSKKQGRWLAIFILFFAVAYVFAYLIYSRDLPVLETDALAYHLPVAMEWLRSGRLSIVQTWYWNPTNTYSPMGAEAFIAWLIAPMGSDIFARYVQAPALLMLLLAMYRIARTLGASPRISAVVAAATVLSRSMFSQAGILKDDLFVAALLLTAAAALADVPEAKRAGDRLSPWRVGIAAGLLLATKYPALIALPLLLLVIGPAVRFWNKTQKAVAVAIPMVLAGPWFVRNAIGFGNPLYPVIIKVAGWHLFNGLFATEPDPAMRTPAGFGRMMSGGYFGTPTALLLAVVILWAIGFFGERSGNPARFFAGAGAIGGAIFFAIASPYPEVRYFLPFLLLFYAGATKGLIALGRWPIVQGIVACGFLALATCTSFETAHIDFVGRFTLEAAVLAESGLGLCVLWQTRRPIAIALLTIIVAIGAGLSYVQFNAYADRVSDNADVVWSETYGPLADAWSFVRHHLPPTAAIAYANTNLIDPLYGPLGLRNLIYAAVRPGLHHLSDLPPMGEHIPQDNIFQAATRAINQNADLSTWLQNLKNAHADFLFLAKHGSSDHPPEGGFISELKWKPIFENDAAAIYLMPNSLQSPQLR
jgi:hypothetical protein